MIIAQWWMKIWEQPTHNSLIARLLIQQAFSIIKIKHVNFTLISTSLHKWCLSLPWSWWEKWDARCLTDAWNGSGHLCLGWNEVLVIMPEWILVHFSFVLLSFCSLSFHGRIMQFISHVQERRINERKKGWAHHEFDQAKCLTGYWMLWCITYEFLPSESSK